MRLSINNMRKREEYLKELIQEKENALREVPEGFLKISYSHGKPQYKLISGKEKKKELYIHSNDIELVRKLAQKTYDERVLKKAKDEIQSISSLVELYEKGNCDDVYDGFSVTRKSLVTPIMIPDDEFVRQWLDDDYEGLGFEEGSPEHYSERGLRVRSKSEASIADKYDGRGIPMKFEKPLRLKGYGTAYPDFTVLSVRFRKVFIHEHMGMMDDPVYAEQNVKKIVAYEKNGYFPGKNLILTFETKQQPFDPRLMDDIIEQYLL